MSANAVNLLSQMEDIRDLDTISMFPLAPGWYGLLVVFLLFIAAGYAVQLIREKRENSWRGDALRNLAALDERLRPDTARDVAAELSAMLRRIAIKKHSRAECAGLEGKAWLKWLNLHDPQQFDWESRGKLLTEAPYAPPGAKLPPDRIRPMIEAAKHWVN
jgi:hypothetical protein